MLTFRLQTTSKYNALATGLPYFEQVVERVRALPGVTQRRLDPAPADDRLQLDGAGVSRRAAASRRARRRRRRSGDSSAGTTSRRWAFRCARDASFTAQDHATSRRPSRSSTRRSRAGSSATPRRRSAGGSSSVSGRGDEERRDRRRDRRRAVPLARQAGRRRRSIARWRRRSCSRWRFVVRTDGDPAQLAAAVRQAAFAVDPTIPVAELQPLDRAARRHRSAGRGCSRCCCRCSPPSACCSASSASTASSPIACASRSASSASGSRSAPRPTASPRSVLRQGAAYAAAGLADRPPRGVRARRG